MFQSTIISLEGMLVYFLNVRVPDDVLMIDDDSSRQQVKDPRKILRQQKFSV